MNHYMRRKSARRGCLFSRRKDGQAPDRATIVYCNRIREVFSDFHCYSGMRRACAFCPLRLLEDAVRRSILLDSGADILTYGMGERQNAGFSPGLAGVCLW